MGHKRIWVERVNASCFVLFFKIGFVFFFFLGPLLVLYALVSEPVLGAAGLYYGNLCVGVIACLSWHLSLSSAVMPLVIVQGKWESTNEPVKSSSRAKRGIGSSGGLLEWSSARVRSGKGPCTAWEWVEAPRVWPREGRGLMPIQGTVHGRWGGRRSDTHHSWRDSKPPRECCREQKKCFQRMRMSRGGKRSLREQALFSETCKLYDRQGWHPKAVRGSISGRVWFGG